MPLSAGGHLILGKKGSALKNTVKKVEPSCSVKEGGAILENEKRFLSKINTKAGIDRGVGGPILQGTKGERRARKNGDPERAREERKSGVSEKKEIVALGRSKRKAQWFLQMERKKVGNTERMKKEKREKEDGQRE